MILGCAIWLGKGSSTRYLTSIVSFILNNPKDTQVSLFYNKNKFNLPEHFKDLYAAFQQEDHSLSIGYDELIHKVEFCDLDFEKDKYIAWLEQFDPTPYAFISDYLRFAILYGLASNKKYSNDEIVFFELDVKFKGPIPVDLPSDSITTPALESALYCILVNKPKDNCLNLLKEVVNIYFELHHKILSTMDVKNNPSSLNILENERYVSTTLGINLGTQEEESVPTLDVSGGHVNLRGFYKVVQGLAKEVMIDYDESIGKLGVLGEMDVSELMDHFPSSRETFYDKNIYKLKSPPLPSIPTLTDESLPTPKTPELPKKMKATGRGFFDDTLSSSKKKKLASDCPESVNEDGPPF